MRRTATQRGLFMPRGARAARRSGAARSLARRRRARWRRRSGAVRRRRADARRRRRAPRDARLPRLAAAARSRRDVDGARRSKCACRSSITSCSTRCGRISARIPALMRNKRLLHETLGPAAAARGRRSAEAGIHAAVRDVDGGELQPFVRSGMAYLADVRVDRAGRARRDLARVAARAPRTGAARGRSACSASS